MPSPISLLYVDDEDVLLELGKIYLEKTGEIKVDLVTSADVALEMIKSGIYDAIVSDYQMPEMDGIEFLIKLREFNPDIPFILFTGRGREEIVIQAINNGADFYLQKGGSPNAQYAELSNMIRKATELRRNAKAIRENEKKFRDFFDAASDPIVILEGDIISDCNKMLSRFLGYSHEEIIGHGIIEFTPEFQHDKEYSESKMSKYQKKATIGDPVVFTWQFSHKDGRILDAEISIIMITINGIPLHHAIIRDVSWRRRQEEIKKLNESRMEAMLTLYRIRDKPVKNIIDFALENCVSLTGSNYGYIAFVNGDETFLLMNSWSDLGMKACRIADKPLCYEVEKTGLWGEPIRQRKPVTVNNYKESEYKKGLPGGHVPITRHAGVPIFHGKQIVMLVGVANKKKEYNNEDIRQITLLMNGLWGILYRKKTEEELLKKNEALASANEELLAIEAELRQKYDEIIKNEKCLRDSERKLYDIINFTPDPTFAIDFEGRVIAWNRAIEYLTGISAKEIVGKGNYEYAFLLYGERKPIFIDLLFSDDTDIRSNYSRITKDGYSLMTESWMNLKGRGKRLLWIKTSPLYDDKGEITGAIESIRDITDWK